MALFSSLTVLCLLCSPALAQSSPSPSQYEPGTCPSRPNIYCAQSVEDSPDRFADSAAQGAGAVNEAMGTPEASASAVSGGGAGSTSPEGAPAGSLDDSGAGVGPGGITELPETGGSPFAALGSGVLLVAFGLAVRRIAGRQA